MKRRRLPEPAVIGFLLPNFLGFCTFLLLPIALSLVMSATNWSLKPAVPTEFLGLRNFNDLLGFRETQPGSAAAAWGYAAAAVGAFVGLATTMWANVARWRGSRIGGAVLVVLGAAVLMAGVAGGGRGAWGGGGPVLLVAAVLWGYLATRGRSKLIGVLALAGSGLAILLIRLAAAGVHSAAIAGAILILAGVASLGREDEPWGLGVGTVPPLVLAAALAALRLLHEPMWSAHELRDPRFWDFLYNTLYLMMGIPFSIAGSLALAMLLSDRLPLGRWRTRLVSTGLCLVCGAVTMRLVWSLGYPNVGLLGGILWLMAAIGVAFNIVSFRTLFYLPTFTSGVALMVLWKALYNPQTGPINVGLAAFFQGFGFSAEAAEALLPQWLASVAWAKPALIFMGVWTAIGGTNMLLYLAGLSNIPLELLDAAHVDGAGWWARFRHVIWPQLAPTTFFISIMSIIGGLQGGFEQARVMTQGGPAGSTTTLSYYIYNKFFEDLDLGYAAAISWILFAFIFIATAINWRFGRELEVVE
jgi:multiple sugar transport system permease protein